MGEAPCVIDFHHPSTVSVNTYDATSAKFASLARQLPIIGNWIADFMNLQFPISSDYNLIRINQFLYKHSFKTFCHIAFLLWFYYYVLIKLLWRRAIGQDMRMVLKRIMRRKNQLYLKLAGLRVDFDGFLRLLTNFVGNVRMTI